MRGRQRDAEIQASVLQIFARSEFLFFSLCFLCVLFFESSSLLQNKQDAPVPRPAVDGQDTGGTGRRPLMAAAVKL